MDRTWAVALAVALLGVSFAGCLEGGDGSPDDPHAAIMEAAREAAKDIDTIEEAQAAGYQPDRFCIPGMGVHWINPSLVDTELDPAKPEVVLFEPSTANFTDPDANRFLAVEYLVVTEGTEHNTTATVPELLGQKLVGPMPGHTPEMPWHAELHVYLAEGIESGPDFAESRPGEITCPEGTTPPAPGESPGNDTGEEPNGTAPTAEPEVELGSLPDAVHRRVAANVSWTVANASEGVEETQLHWAETSVAEPSEGAYGNTSEATLENGAYHAEVTVPGMPDANGTLYLRAHAVVDGTTHWSDEVQVPIEGLQVHEVTMQDVPPSYNPSELEVSAPAYVVWSNTGDVNHTVTFEQLNGTQGYELADLGPGQSVGYVFTEPRGYDYRCTYHSTDYSTGMVGNLTVTSSG